MSTSELTARVQAPSEGPVRSRGPWLQALARFRRRPLGIAAVLVILAFAVVAVIADLVTPYPAGRLFLEYLNRPQPPSLHHGHLLGTDVLGHDMLSQLLVAIRESMIGAFVCAVGATVIGVAVGALAGFYGGALDSATGWLTGVVVTMPAVAIIVLIVVYEAPIGPIWLGVALMLYLWTAVARVVRASFASLRVQEFVDAAHAAGASNSRVIFRHLLPNTAGVVIVAATAIVGQSIVIIATVDYFDFGAQQSDQPTLGGLVANAAKGVGLAATPWWLYAIPAIALGLLLVCVNIAADTLDDALNPGRG
jgi:ABC-type dipeptide/oligopeptide/nickel transport system permease subunit